MNAFLKGLKYINWRQEAIFETYTIDAFNELLEDLTANGTEVREGFTIRLNYKEDYWSLTQKGYWKKLYFYRDGKYHVIFSHALDDKKNQDQQKGLSVPNKGLKCNTLINEKFKELNGVSRRKAFGYCDKEKINKCCPKQLYYIKGEDVLKELNHVSKVDYSSHYPASQCGRMPTWTGCKEVEGCVKPTEEYPFAFYLKAQMCAEYGVFDMHDWYKKDKYREFVFNLYYDEQLINRDADIGETTILCKASEYTMDSTFDYFYSEKKNDKYKELKEGITAKDVLNASIGYEHLKNMANSRNRLDHLACITIARANQKILDLACQPGIKGRVLMIVVDSIIYKSPYYMGDKEEKLGSLKQEHLDCDFIMRGTNQYMFFKDGQCVDMCHSAFNDNLLHEKLEDINLWQKK